MFFFLDYLLENVGILVFLISKRKNILNTKRLIFSTKISENLFTLYRKTIIILFLTDPSRKKNNLKNHNPFSKSKSVKDGFATGIWRPKNRLKCL